MSALAPSDVSEEQFLAIVAEVCAADASLSSVAAGVMAAIHLGISKDSRTFSRIFGVAHALVLREITGLSDDRGLVRIASRNDRTQRTELALTDKGQELLSSAIAIHEK
jgi:DNA-binding MarR family transcriptional regulator